MNVVHITLVFGIGMPALFPIAALNLMVMYIEEKFMLYYAYKRPPTYDTTLHNEVLLSLESPVILLLPFTFWMLSNPKLL